MKRRRYISLDIDDFFLCLNTANIRYVVLRWFETLPEIEKGEDIDLLVHDEDFEKLDPFFSLTRQKNTVPCDVYSISGISGSDFEGMPYYPKHMATSMLKNRVLYKEKYFVPNPRDHFFSMAYHAVYHKGIRSGLPKSKEKKPLVKKPEHNYKQVLTELSKAIDIDVDITWDDLNLLLISCGWSPTINMFKKLSKRRKWVRSLYNHVMEPINGGDLTSFILRDWGYEKNLLNFAINWLESCGFSIIYVHIIEEFQKDEVTRKIRGGSWERGSWIRNGGGPAVLLVAYDPHPISLPKVWRKRYPLANNGRLLWKRELRKALNKQVKRRERANMIHSSDNPIEAMEYIKVICPNKITEIFENIKGFNEKYTLSENRIKKLHGRNGKGPFTIHDHQRGKTELINRDGKLLIKKTFLPGRERFLQREVFAYKTLSQKCSLIPPLLEHGENYFIIPYYEKLSANKELYHKHKEDIRTVLKFLYDESYAHLDFLPRNILFTKEGLKVLDFEFLYKYSSKPASFTDSYDIVSIPKNFDGELPLMGIHTQGLRAYNRAWKKACGYSLANLID